MAKHGGFAIALQLKQETLQTMLVLAHRGGELPTSLNGPRSLIDVGNPQQSAELDYLLHVDVPIIELDPVQSSTHVHATVRLAGKMRIKASSADDAWRKVRLRLAITAVLTGEIVKVADGPDEDTKADFNLVSRFSDVTVVTAALDILDGAPLPPIWQNLFSSAIFTTVLSAELGGVLAEVPTLLPAELLPVLTTMRIGSGSSATVTSLIGDGFITFGIDLVNPGHGVDQHGNPALVKRFLSQGDLAIIIDPGVTPLLAAKLKKVLQKELDKSSDTLESLSLSFHGNYFKIAGAVSDSAGDAEFSLRATPTLGRPESVEISDDEYGQSTIVHAASDEIWMDLSHVDLDVTLAGWLQVVIGFALVPLSFVMTPMFAVTFFAALIDDVIRSIEVDAVTSGEPDLLSRRTVTSIAGVDKVPVELFVTSCQVFADRMQSRATLTADRAQTGFIEGPSRVAARDLTTYLAYRLEPSLLDYHPADPEVRIRWQVRRLDTNQVVHTVERPPGHAMLHRIKLRFSWFGAGTQAINRFSISARVYRRGGGQPDFDYFNTSIKINIDDRLDRSHPYHRWSHEVVTPEVKVLPGGAHQVLGKRIFVRDSVIHRTAVPGRCRFADQFSTDLPAPTYLDALPFAEADLAAHRGEVCDYCFYGGPDKTEPLIGKPPFQIKLQPGLLPTP